MIVPNNTVTDNPGLSDTDINIIIFGGIAVTLICCIPALIGKNGRIRSRAWFSKQHEYILSRFKS